MNRRIRNISFLAAVILLLIAAVSYEKSFYAELSNKNISRQAQRYISAKSKAINKYHDVLKEAVEGNQDLWSLPISNNYIVAVSSRDKVDYWNSNRISPDNIPFSQQLICRRIDNAWFLYKSNIVDSHRIDVLVNIKNNYSISNEYFVNDNADQSELSQYSFSEKPQIGYTAVYGETSIPLFYFAKTELNDHNRRHSLLATTLYFALLLVILIFLSLWHTKRVINLLSLLSFGALVVVMVRFFNFIPILKRTFLFSDEVYSRAGLLNNLGMLVIAALIFIVFTYTISGMIRRSFRPNLKQSFGILLLLTLLFYAFMQLYVDIIHHTNINFQIFKIRLITQETFWVYGLLLLFIGGWGKLLIAFTTTFHSQKYIFLAPLLVLIVTAPLLLDCPTPIISAVILIWFSLISIHKRHLSQYALVHMLIACILLASMVTFVTERESLARGKAQKKTLITSLSPTLLNERDYKVEEQLEAVWNEIQSDMTLQNIPMMMFNSPEYYANYFQHNYFSGYLKEYDLQVVICNPEHYLQIDGMATSPNCYNYFATKLEEEGEQIKNTGFYWQHDNNGRVSYFGWLKIAKNTLLETSIFIDLESQVLSIGQGYPELLRDQSQDNNLKPKGYSFARYANGRLITSSGDFRYPPTNKWIPETDSTIFDVNFDRHSHLCYHNTDNSTVILSENSRSIFHPVYAFIYTFLLFFFAFATANGIAKKKDAKINRSFSNDIRLTIYAVLLLSLFMVGTASVLFPVNIYKKNQENTINEKSESFLMSISREMTNITNIYEVAQPSLQNLLHSLSNTLYKDVHVYDLNGKLYASSRPQLFNYKLQSNIMSPKAYRALKFENRMAKMDDETIGSNEYKSNYLVITNANEEPLAYVNVPFFSSQQELKSAISDYLVLLLNIYLLLIILVIILTYLSVSTITKPLSLIQEGLTKMKLGSNEKISYNRDDEVGSLVEKYNVMVDELNASVKQLAKNEREVAWQGMARQIAHEIKNPLTPMKLSIQHLARTKNGAPEMFDDYFNKTAHTLIEQIDNLSNIATSFSTFAKISDGVPETLELNERLSSIATLFGQSRSKVEFIPASAPIQVYMDKDHFIQIFNNLIKNALQAIPEDKDGKIEISLSEQKNTVVIDVKDNGKGIDEETKDKIFQPNFTTKNSGMGLGLAISQKMINNAGGNISFTSTEGMGAIFSVSLPIE